MVTLKRYSTLILESKKDLDDLKEFLGGDLFDDYMKIRDKISDPEYKDFGKLKKKDIKDIGDYVSTFQSNTDKRKLDKQEGTQKIYSNPYWDVYKITSYPAAQLYGSNTKWCITGRYPGHEGRGLEYFNDYIEDNDLDGGYYFIISKSNPKEKYCLLRKKNGDIHSIWNAEDTSLDSVNTDDLPLGDFQELAEEIPLFGENLTDYIDNVAGTEYDPYEAIIEMLSNDPPYNISRLRELLRNLDTDDGLDPFYEALCTVNNGITEDRYKAFEELCDYALPSSEFIREYRLCESCLAYILEGIHKNKDYLYDHLSNEDASDYYALTLFKDILDTYGTRGSDYRFIYDPKIMKSLIDQLDEYALSDWDISESIIYDLPEVTLEDLEFAGALLDKGLSIESVFDDLSSEYIPIIKGWVANGGDINEINKGYPLFYRILANSDPSISDVKWFLEHGADPTIVDADGETGDESTDNPEIRKLLQNYIKNNK